MNRQKRCIKDLVLYFCFGIITLLMGAIFFRFFTKNVLIDIMGLGTGFSKPVFYNSAQSISNENETNSMDINWAELYPFTIHSNYPISKNDEQISSHPLSSYKNTIENMEKKITEYSRNSLIGYQKIVEAANQYDDCIGWNIAARTEYNAIVSLSDGSLIFYEDKQNVTSNISTVSDLYQFCTENNSNFLYVQAPGKICQYEDSDIYGKLDFSNQNADVLLSGLEERTIPVLDLRKELHKDYTSHHALFYKTDHHWKGQTGLWAAYTLAEQINAKFGYHIDLDLLNSNSFETITYENWFLGASGKKLTLTRTAPEDFQLLYPKYQTAIQYIIPDREINEFGDFSITYDMNQLERKDYYNLNPYGAYNHGNLALIKLRNNDDTVQGKVLLLKDSFGNCTAPFLSLGIKELDVIDLRLFTGSIKNYIKTENPDLIILMYSPYSIDADIDYSSHTHLFDFS